MDRLYRQIKILENRKKGMVSEGINIDDITMDLQWMYNRLGSYYSNKFHKTLGTKRSVYRRPPLS